MGLKPGPDQPVTIFPVVRFEGRDYCCSSSAAPSFFVFVAAAAAAQGGELLGADYFRLRSRFVAFPLLYCWLNWNGQVDGARYCVFPSDSG
ncbi:hypothetical protein MLD38_028326 [Melastoma candidum]|uniref:Uncharacterized protein n=1 Tax=Melastoma candidum TaxID=119954 RepID=A0ACB9N0G5_9MYRT|nr:hypothetical protein MLD38_028326 [Melastoma candidum]